MAPGTMVAESTECTAGSLRNRRTSTSTALSRVAENSIRWLSGGVASSSRRTTGRKPRSAMWSASSSTLISTSPRWQCPCSMRSASRPGQATTMSARLRRAATCAFCPMPPKMVATVRPVAWASGASTAWTWLASSRVGTSTRPRGRPALVYPSASPATSGIENASVFPDPVRPRPRMSRPANASGSVAAWIGKGTVMPAPVSTSSRGPGTSSSAKLVRTGVTPAGRRSDPAGCLRSCCAAADCGWLACPAARAEDSRFTRRRRGRGACEASVSARVKGISLGSGWPHSRRPPPAIRGNHLAHTARYDRRARMAAPHELPCAPSLPHAGASPRRAAPATGDDSHRGPRGRLLRPRPISGKPARNPRTPYASNRRSERRAARLHGTAGRSLCVPGTGQCDGWCVQHMSQVRGPVVGRHSDAIDVTGPIDMTGLDRRRRSSLALFAIAAAILVAAAAIAVLLLAT